MPLFSPQWARIVLATERMLTPKQRLAAQKLYSQSLGATGERALIMRLRTHENRQQVCGKSIVALEQHCKKNSLANL